MKYVALLRAINVGGRTVKMERLRALFASAGFSNVTTFIASGNVLFESPMRSVPNLESRIEGELHEALGFEVSTFVRTPAELAAVARHTPFESSDGQGASSLYVAFLKREPAAGQAAKLVSFNTPADKFAVHGREAWWLSQPGMGKSKFSGAALERALGTPATMRNITTVRKLATL